MDIYVKRGKCDKLVVGTSEYPVDMVSDAELSKVLPVLKDYQANYKLTRYAVQLLWYAIVHSDVLHLSSPRRFKTKVSKGKVLVNYYGIWLPLYKRRDEVLMRIHNGANGQVVV